MKTLLMPLLLASALAYSAWNLPWVSYDQQFADCVSRTKAADFCDIVVPK